LSSFALSTALFLISPPTILTPLAPVAPVDAIEVAQAAPPSVPVEPQTAPASPEDKDIVVTGSRRSPSDPIQKINVESFAVTQAVDLAVIRPVAKGYEKIVPSPARDGIRNALNNLREPVVFLNFILQHKIGKAVRTLGRFAVNSTIGIGGLVDVARRKPFKLPRHPNGFADTLGFYGVKPGAFLYVPLVGPTTVRDLIGTTVDRFMLPFVVGGPFKNTAVTISIGVFSTLDQRAQLDETLQALRQDKTKAYQASREFYLARRQAQIDELHGKGRRIVRPNPGSVKPLILDAPEQK
jgi:phospholipid-binding lipoprotein MlaA